MASKTTFDHWKFGLKKMMGIFFIGRVFRTHVTPLIQVTVHSGPGKFTVTAGMVASMQNNHTAQVLLLNPVELEMPEGLAEWITGNVIQVCCRQKFLKPYCFFFFLTRFR